MHSPESIFANQRRQRIADNAGNPTAREARNTARTTLTPVRDHMGTVHCPCGSETGHNLNNKPAPLARCGGERCKTTTVFTMAPEAADYSHSQTLERFKLDDTGRAEWRKVAITTDDYRTSYQCDRYGSFLRGVVTLDDPRVTPLGEGRPGPSNYGR